MVATSPLIFIASCASLGLLKRSYIVFTLARATLILAVSNMKTIMQFPWPSDDPPIGARFSSTRSFKHRDPFWNAGEKFVDRLEVFLLQVREISQNLILCHSGCQVRCEIIYRKTQATNARLATHFAGFN